MVAQFIENIKNNRYYSKNCLVLTGEKYNSFVLPCVYGWRNEDTWLYIGKSICGAFNRLHTHKNDKKEIEDSHQVFIWFFPEATDSELLAIEKQLLWELNPLYNKAGTPRIAEKNRLKREKTKCDAERRKVEREEAKKHKMEELKIYYSKIKRVQQLEHEAIKLLSLL